MADKGHLLRSPLTAAGMALTVLSAILFLMLVLADVFAPQTNPYTGVISFLLLSASSVLGLLIAAIGVWRERRRQARGDQAGEFRWPRLDLNLPLHRRLTFLFLILIAVNIVIVATGSYHSIEYMDSSGFCGTSCHVPMKPEFTAHQDGAHSRVDCVVCHIGSGASSFVAAKVSGVRRVVSATFNTFERPIPAPVRSLRPARDTCETCHWPEKYHGDRIVRVAEYAEDAENTESVTTLRVHVGGGSERLGTAEGIHWHMNLANVVEYIATDAKHQVIPWVRFTDRSGAVREYVVDGVTPDELARGERRRMDCMDCHNRPSHVIAATPERAVNEAMANGLIPRTLPFIKREAVKALKETYPTQEEAAAGIARAIRGYYPSGSDGPDAADLDRAVQAVIDVYKRNVFPEMKVGFGTYPNNIGHIDFPGCFRCHDEEHKTKDGRTIGQDCEACHTIE